jgi:hypothetical protein
MIKTPINQACERQLPQALKEFTQQAFLKPTPKPFPHAQQLLIAFP